MTTSFGSLTLLSLFSVFSVSFSKQIAYEDNILASGTLPSKWKLMFVSVDDIDLGFQVSEAVVAPAVARNGSNMLNSGYEVLFYALESKDTNQTLVQGPLIPTIIPTPVSTCAITFVSKYSNCDEEVHACYVAVTNEHCMDPVIEMNFHNNISLDYTAVRAYDSSDNVSRVAPWMLSPTVGYISEFVNEPNIGDFLTFDLLNNTMGEEAYFQSTTIGDLTQYEWLAMEDMHYFTNVSKIGPKTGWTDGIFVGSLWQLRQSKQLSVTPEMEPIYNSINFSGMVCKDGAGPLAERGDCGSLIFNQKEKVIYGHVGGYVHLIASDGNYLKYLQCMYFTPIENTRSLMHHYGIEFNLKQRIVQSATPTNSPSKSPSREVDVGDNASAASKERITDNELTLYLGLAGFVSLVGLGGIVGCVYLIRKKDLRFDCCCFRTTAQYQQVAGNNAHVSTVPMVSLSNASDEDPKDL